MKLMKKFALIALILALGRPTLIRARKETTIPAQVDMNNPYTASIIAGILPQDETEEKTKILEGVVERVKSLSPDLGLLESYYESGQPKKVVTLLNKTPGLKELVIKHPRAGLVVIKTFIKLGLNTMAMHYLTRLNEKHPTDQEIAFLAAQFYEQKNQYKKALTIIDNYLNKAVKKHANFAFLFLKSRLYTKMGNNKNALASIEEALKIQPKFDLGWFMFAQMKEKKGELKAAIKGYTNYLETASSRPTNLAGHILQKAIEAKLLKLLFDQTVKKHPNPERDRLERCRSRVMNLFKQKKYKDALQELDSCLSGQASNEETRLMKIQVLGAMKQYEQAAELIKTWILEDPQKSLWFETLHLLYYAGLDSRVIIKTLLDIDKKCPNNLFAALYLADMFTRNAESQQARNYHHKALALTDDPELKTSIYFQLGLLYYEKKEFARMRTALENGRALGLNYTPLLNLLAYYYTTRGNNLIEAQRLMQIVLKDDPGNPHFLDTQALILYRQGKYEHAVALLEEIVKKEPDDVTVVKHLARTYQKLGRLKQGVACLERVVTLTYDKNKKQKYQQVLNRWKTKTHEKKSGQLLCCR